MQDLAAQTPTSTKELSGPHPDDTAYMIYTSGSTGTPKGIEIPHSAALAFCLSERSCLETSTADVVWQGFSSAFDMFIEEVWVSIAGGAHLAIGNRTECQDVPSLGGATGIWAQRNITLVNAVPTLINIMTSLDSECPLPPSVRLLNLGGEACPPALVNRLWSPSLRILNTYGPSETTVTATFQELFPDQQVTIGKPLPLYHALLMEVRDDADKTWSPTPLPLKEGAEGELAIGGPCLGKGYVKRPELTNEKFISHPLPSRSGERLYRTGDLVRLDKNLNIVFLGRIDTQVKHRGYRIELGEIEHAIATHARVQTVAVTLSICTDRLEAYVVCESSDKIEPRELRNNLRHLPAYMQPEEIFFISPERMPRLPSGKINAKALQQISEENFAATQTEGSSSAGSIRTASTLVGDSDLGLVLRTMADMFPKSAKIKRDSDFFDDLGGHSLIAAQLVSRLRKDSPEGSPLKTLGLQRIYQYRTAEAIVASFGGSSEVEKCYQSDAAMGDHWGVSKWNYVFCGIAQIPALFFFFLVEAITILVPYLVFFFMLRGFGLGCAILVTYIIFVAIPLARAIIGIAGKWISIGKVKEGEYPLYGVYYYRWWLADHFVNLVDMVSIAETPLLPALFRCMGARVGESCHIGVLNAGPAFDLVSIGDDVVFGKDIVLATSWVERGRLILAPVTVGSDVHVGSNSVLEGSSLIEDGGELGPMSMLPQDCRILAGEQWTGSPAQYHKLSQDVGNMRNTRPSQARLVTMILAMGLSSTFILPIIYFAPQIPSMLLFEYVNIAGVGWYVQTAIVCVPAAVIYMLLVFIELIILKWMVLGRVVEHSYRTTSVYFFRKWLIDRLMDISLVVLQPVYATLYVVPFLRCLGVKIGHGAEVSTARGINFELTEIGEQSFVADRVIIGNAEVRHNIVKQRRTQLHKRTFLGNGAMVPQGTELASNTLVGVLSIVPETPLKEGQSCFGSPAVIMPARQRCTVNHSDQFLFNPTFKLRALRLSIEGLRILLPRTLIVFGLGFGLQVFETGWKHVGVWPMLLLLPMFYFCFFAIASIIIPILLKWMLIGRYHPAEWPLWSLNVWKSEFVTSVYETLSPFCADMLTGTPFMAWFFRAMGVQIGHRTTLLSNDITEYDMVSIGDEAVLNRHAGPQTHLFEDRIMKVGRVDIEDRGCMKAYGVALPGSRIATGGQLGCLSLVMKGETVPSREAWEGAPIAPRAQKPERMGKASSQ
ncbi:non-ribosomal peptide synthetase module [Cadophora sp. MPI-SDFR-AT-0126]|nr:non-ribosomal peptide synthetase module [Leotiomycetes sp. MPI-SDFR-AT-0126]